MIRSAHYAYRLRWLPVLLLTHLFTNVVRAEGPQHVAGSSYFNPSVKGTPLTWAQGSVTYYTDQGDLSPVLPGQAADSFVASAFGLWTSVPTAAVVATRGGQLAEDVNGSNVYVNPDRTITMPADILPTAVGAPVGIVYDADGAVTDALLGSGASGSLYCYSNSVFGGPDNFSADAHLTHALVILNGNCAQASGQLPDFQYHLVRILGRVLGLGWSQVNLNAITRNPAPTSGDFAGFPVMHPADPTNCVPVSVCYANADQPKMDDQAAISQLYPVTSQNLASFSGKQLFYENTVRVRGSVYFVDSSGSAAQPMQGVNVVARWIDPSTGQPSRQYAASSVSGFLFRGNAGNIITGFMDGSGQPLDRFGSDDAVVEGAFDLVGLQIPDGAGSAQYQLTVEPLDPLWSQAVEPYGPSQVSPSGTAAPIIVAVSRGNSAQQTILMQGSANYPPDPFKPNSYATPAPLIPTGEWFGTLTGYAAADFFSFAGQAKRTLSVEVTALDETGAASEGKAMPVAGMWALADPGTTPAPAETPSAFNSFIAGETRLDAVLKEGTNFRLGIADYRGDGRPDYRYQARLFYGDNVVPARASAAGGTPVGIQGFGFRPNTVVSLGANATKVLSTSSNQVVIAAPALSDGVQNVALSDPATGAASTMTEALTFGAGPSDTIQLISEANPATPVGVVAPNPMVVEVVAAGGAAPVSGASVFFSAAPTLALSTCGNANSCTVFTDATGRASTFMTVLSAATFTISAQLAPASYSPPAQVQTTLLGISPALAIGLNPPYAWIAQGATLDVPLVGRVIANGAPVAGRTVNYYLVKGSATLGAPSAVTDANGNANVNLHIAALAGDVQVSVCVEPGDAPCQTFYGTAVPLTGLQVQLVSGGGQIVDSGVVFQPVTVRVTNSSAHSVLAAPVSFLTEIFRPAFDQPIIMSGEDILVNNAEPILLGASLVKTQSDMNGLATVQPSVGAITGSTQVLDTVTAGAASLQFLLQTVHAPGN